MLSALLPQQPLQRRSKRCALNRATAMAQQTVPPCVIIGAGRVGAALQRMGDGADVVVKRGEQFPALPQPLPILIATRNDALAGIVEATPPNRREDLVFMQNGMLQPFLDARGLGDATQVLIYFAVAKLGEMPTDGVTDLEPEGLTAACGKHAAAVAARLHRQGLACRVLPPDAFRACMLEKLIWISAFMLVGAAHPGATVGDVERQHSAEVRALIEELAQGTSAAAGVEFGPRLADRLCAYARAVAHFPTAVKEFEWRNGWFVGFSKQAMGTNFADPFPKHTALLKQVGAWPA